MTAKKTSTWIAANQLTITTCMATVNGQPKAVATTAQGHRLEWPVADPTLIDLEEQVADLLAHARFSECTLERVSPEEQQGLYHQWRATRK
jgi:hypothetical protein